MIDAFCATVREAGYLPGIYGSEYNLWRKVDPNSFGNAIIWVAHYGRQPDIPCDLWQDSDSGRFPGYNGPVDTDVVRSERFMRLVTRQGDAAPAAEETPNEGHAADADETAPDISGTLGLLAAYLQTPQFKENFLKFIEEGSK